MSSILFGFGKVVIEPGLSYEESFETFLHLFRNLRLRTTVRGYFPPYVQSYRISISYHPCEVRESLTMDDLSANIAAARANIQNISIPI